ncbi:hypothetical protein JTB14_029947 [Gonioctena quinquepunctata]|nr:hypothetical protein JTB14_029947 [Gonioctena quinquepunctata]
MYKLLRFTLGVSKSVGPKSSYKSMRTFLSESYNCQEIWDKRLNSPVLQKVNLDELYHELDQRFQKTRQISAVDVDIFANATDSKVFIDELLDLVHKLRLTADTGNTLNSTAHAFIRAMMRYGKKEDLLRVLDDRLNYGIFLDYYSANLLMDEYWKNNDSSSGAIIGSQLMLQEEYEHPISLSLSLLHFYTYLLNPEGWPNHSPPEEPEEEVKVRVKYLRNPYDDDHFDLRDPYKIIGKSLTMFTKQKQDSLNKSLCILGFALYNKPQQVMEYAKQCQGRGTVLFKEILDLIPNDNESKEIISTLQVESVDVQKLLKLNVERAVQTMSERDIADQCEVFSKWEIDRLKALEEQKERLTRAKRIQNIDDLNSAIREKERKLWFFENEEKIELEIEEASEKKVFTNTKIKAKEDIDYVPPEVSSRQSN